MAVEKYISKSYLVSNLKNFKTVILDGAYAALSTTYSKTEVDNLVSAIPKFEIKPVDSLPTTDISNATVYLLKTSETETGNLYTEYIYVNNTWEKLGTQTMDLTGYYTSTQIDTKLGDKVDKVSGKGLSEADFTSAEKTKLAGISEGAEVNVQADWNVTDPASDAYILNKPTSLPASDVPAWAKAENKPTYTYSDVGALADTTTHLSGDVPTSRKVNGKALTTDITLSASDVGAATSADITTAIEDLDVTGAASIGAGKTIASWSETDGKVSITTQNISITKSQISDFPASLPVSNLTSTFNATDTANAVNGVAVASAISGKANASDVPTEETSNIDFTTEWNTTPAAEG